MNLTNHHKRAKTLTKLDRPVKRLEAAAKSPVFSQIASSLQGLTTIRAFGAEGMLVKEFDREVTFLTS